MELTMIQQQLYGTSLIATPAKIISETGIKGMFRGLETSCLREAIFVSAMLGLGPVVKKYGAEELGMSTNSSKMFGACTAGVIVSTLSHPVDTIKTCQQGDIMKKEFGGVMGTCQTLMKQGGIPRFFGGWSWRTSRCIVQAFLWDECRTRLSPLFFPHHFQEER
mmetsp:Transcript_22505/g.26527  ORF Transcript_22505/g.26527 Transcript_22505/m.26527 type:complete len:164 (-) Transcript_22505:27-518(-)